MTQPDGTAICPHCKELRPMQKITLPMTGADVWMIICPCVEDVEFVEESRK